MLGGEADDRHGSLESALRWSWDLLDDKARQLLATLSAFRGGCDLEAVEEVGGTDDAAETLRLLRDRSLVTRAVDPRLPADSRYDLLESIRTFAARRLAEFGETEVFARHARWFVAEGATLVTGLRTPRRQVCLARLGVEAVEETVTRLGTATTVRVAGFQPST